MEDGCIGVIGGKMQFKYLTNKLSEKDYSVLKIKCWLGMVNDFERPVKWFKPNNKGTGVNFTTIKTKEDYKNALDELENHIETVNGKYGFGIKLERKEVI